MPALASVRVFCRLKSRTGARPLGLKKSADKNADNEIAHGLRLALATVFTVVVAALSSTGFAAQPRVQTVREPRGDSATFMCKPASRGRNGVEIVNATLAGVPAILRVPDHVSRPPIVLWHGFGAPAGPHALMDALPLDRVPAVKVYLGLPLFGARAPVGGVDELVRRQKQDFAELLFKPSVVGAADELSAVVVALEQRGCMTPGNKIGLFGFSAGGASVLIALAQHHVAVGTAVVLNASTGLNASVHALERVTKRRYAWTPAARALARETDAVQHAQDIARGDPPPALLILQGADDQVLTPQPAIALHNALLPYYRESPDRLQFDLVPGLSHSWSDSKLVGQIQDKVAGWFLRYE